MVKSTSTLFDLVNGGSRKEGQKRQGYKDTMIKEGPKLLKVCKEQRPFPTLVSQIRGVAVKLKIFRGSRVRLITRAVISLFFRLIKLFLKQSSILLQILYAT